MPSRSTCNRTRRRRSARWRCSCRRRAATAPGTWWARTGCRSTNTPEHRSTPARHAAALHHHGQPAACRQVPLRKIATGVAQALRRLYDRGVEREPAVGVRRAVALVLALGGDESLAAGGLG